MNIFTSFFVTFRGEVKIVYLKSLINLNCESSGIKLILLSIILMSVGKMYRQC